MIGNDRGTSLYNDFWQNNLDPTSTPGQRFFGPKFTDAAKGDFTLRAGYSPCIDANDPILASNDLDGSRSDLGAYGGRYGEWP